MSLRCDFQNFISSKSFTDNQKMCLPWARKGVIANCIYRKQPRYDVQFAWLYPSQYKSNWIPKWLIWSTCRDNSEKKKSRLWVLTWLMTCVKLLWWWAKVNVIGQTNILRDVNHTVFELEETLGITWKTPALNNLVNAVSERSHFIQSFTLNYWKRQAETLYCLSPNPCAFELAIFETKS